MAEIETPERGTTLIDNISNWFFVVAVLWVLYWVWTMYRLTRVKWVFVISLGFLALTAIRIGVAIHQPWISANSRMISDITIVLFAIGFPMLVLVLRKAYSTDETRPAIDTAAHIKYASDAAQKLRQHAMDAAEHARLAGLHALEAAAFADRATIESRKATKDSGMANEASRMADSQVGRDPEDDIT